MTPPPPAQFDLAASGLRKLRMALTVAQSGRFSLAADQLGVSQPAVTRAVASLEDAIGLALFDRSTVHVAQTEAGTIVIGRAARAFAHLVGPDGSANLVQASDHELRALLATQEQRSIVRAARVLGLSPPAVSRSLLTLERRLGRKLYRRTRLGLLPEPGSETLTRRIKLAYSELRQAEDDLAVLVGRGKGRLSIGTLPIARSGLVPSATLATLDSFPDAEITLQDGTWDSLAQQLRDGDIDLVVGSIRRLDDDPGLTARTLFDDTIAIVAGAKHPLTGIPHPRLSDMLAYRWILPLQGVPLRTQFEALVTDSGGVLPDGIISTDSTAALRTFLLDSDRLAIAAHQQVHDDVNRGLLSLLPIQVPRTRRAIGMTTRRDHTPTALFECFVEKLVSAAATYA